MTSIKDLPIQGRVKNKNLIITGPANCVKTFILKPLKLIFNDSIFESPDNNKHAWAGSEKAKVFLLNDSRKSKDLNLWNDMLVLLAGETVKLTAPRKIYSKGIVISTDVAISATNKSPTKYRGPHNASDDRETKMMAANRETLRFVINFSTGAKNPASLLKMFCKFPVF